MKQAVTAIALALLLASGAAAKKYKPVWQASRTTDPITGKTGCVVAAYDQAAGLSFTRTGGLYPIVENNAELGLLVGVSSGGRMRIPSGDVEWRVDDRPHRVLKAADNPAGHGEASADISARAMQDTLALTRALTSTSTVASGQTARDMLAEMVAGHGLQFRRAAASAAYGLPSEAMYLTGRITKEGLKPYPLDASFAAGLAACGITEVPVHGGAETSRP